MEIFLAATSALIAFILIEAFFLIRYGIIAKKLAREIAPFSAKREEYPRVLFFGDSTAWGTGASSSEHSIAGQLARDFPGVSVYNFSKNGIGTRELSEIIENNASEKADLVILQIGGMDIISLRSLKKFEPNLENIFLQAKKIGGGRVLMVSPHNVGTLPYFRPPISFLFHRRSKRVNAAIQKLVIKHEIAYADLYAKKHEDPFMKDKARYFAKDGIHPTSEGYSLWYIKIRKAIEKFGWDNVLNQNR